MPLSRASPRLSDFLASRESMGRTVNRPMASQRTTQEPERTPGTLRSPDVNRGNGDNNSQDAVVQSNGDSVPKNLFSTDDRDAALTSKAGDKRGLGISSWPVLYSALVGFSAVAWDVSSPFGFHLFSSIDQSMHEWVLEHIPETFRLVLFDKLLSNFFILFPLVMWLRLDSIKGGGTDRRLIAQSYKRIKKRGYVFSAAGATFMMVVFKELVFCRNRPRSDLATLSFPSGHTMGAVMLTSMLLLVRLRVKDGAGKDQAAQILGDYSSFVVVLAGVTTAVGRICSDSHWVSDTVAGGLLGLAATSALANFYRTSLEE